MIGTPKLRRLAATSIVALIGLALQSTTGLADIIERYVANAIGIGTPGPPAAGTVEIAVERWSTDAERDRLLSVLLEKGTDKLLDELQKLPRVGYIRTPDSIGYDLHYARKAAGEDGGEHAVLATDRYITFWEAVSRPRTIDYPFTLIELHIGPDGKGEGKMSIATKIIYDKKKNEIVLEQYQSQPVLLTEVRKEARTPAR
jgi:hypothetical protein